MANNFYKTYKSSMQNKPFRMGLSRLGSPTSPMVAKQLEEMGKRLNSGVKNVEIGTISADKFEFIPQQHFDEIRRLAKLTDSHVSVHGPLLDLAGFPEQGGGKWSEESREGTERQLFSILERSFRLGNGENVPVVFHAGHFQSQEYEKDKVVTEIKKIVQPDGTIRKVMEQKPREMGFRSIVAVNRDTGDVTKLDYEVKYTPGEKNPEIWDPMRRLANLNQTSWDDEKIKILTRLNEMEKLKTRFDEKIKQNEVIENTGLITDKSWQQVYKQNQLDINLKLHHLDDQNRKLESEYREVYNKFMKFTNPDDIKKYYKDHLDKLDKDYNESKKEIEKKQQELAGIRIQINNLDEKSEEHARAEKFLQQKEFELGNMEIDRNKYVLSQIGKLPSPELWEPVGEFSIEKTAKTVSNALEKMYSQLKKEGKQDQTPFIALENFFVNAPMSTAEDLRKAVEKSREMLAKRLVEKDNLSDDDAKNTAEKLVGATWDVGHINNLRKAGFEGEELKKKVLQQTKEIADVTKHVHITDNFGFHDSHLPPGMGNVPISQIMEELEKKWSELRESGKISQEPRAIAEAGGFVGEIGQDPNLAILEYFGSPFYKVGASPYFWGPGTSGIAHTYTPYFESFVEFPQQHFNMYGSSFTTLPKSLGGQVGGEASRFSGTPNQ